MIRLRTFVGDARCNRELIRSALLRQVAQIKSGIVKLSCCCLHVFSVAAPCHDTCIDIVAAAEKRAAIDVGDDSLRRPSSNFDDESRIAREYGFALACKRCAHITALSICDAGIDCNCRCCCEWSCVSQRAPPTRSIAPRSTTSSLCFAPLNSVSMSNLVSCVAFMY